MPLNPPALSAAILLAAAFAGTAPLQAQPTGAAAAQNQPVQTPSMTSAPAPAEAQAPAAAASAPAAATAPAQTAGGDLDQVVCRNMPPKTGSRLGGGRECHSQREWNRMQQESQDVTRRQQQLGYASGGR